MNVDKAFANFEFNQDSKGGDTGRGRVERISFLQLSIIYSKSWKQVLSL
jgi:hypothetical protein